METRRNQKPSKSFYFSIAVYKLHAMGAFYVSHAFPKECFFCSGTVGEMRMNKWM